MWSAQSPQHHRVSLGLNEEARPHKMIKQHAVHQRELVLSHHFLLFFTAVCMNFTIMNTIAGIIFWRPTTFPQKWRCHDWSPVTGAQLGWSPITQKKGEQFALTEGHFKNHVFFSQIWGKLWVFISRIGDNFSTESVCVNLTCTLAVFLTSSVFASSSFSFSRPVYSKMCAIMINQWSDSDLCPHIEIIQHTTFIFE